MKKIFITIKTWILVFTFIYVLCFFVELIKRYNLDDINENQLVSNMVILNDTLFEEIHENIIQRAQGCISELCIKTKPYLFHADLSRNKVIYGCELTINYYYDFQNKVLSKIKFKDENDCVQIKNNYYKITDGYTTLELDYHIDEFILDIDRLLVNKFIKKITFNGKTYKM